MSWTVVKRKPTSKIPLYRASKCRWNQYDQFVDCNNTPITHSRVFGATETVWSSDWVDFDPHKHQVDDMYEQIDRRLVQNKFEMKRRREVRGRFTLKSAQLILCKGLRGEIAFSNIMNNFIQENDYDADIYQHLTSPRDEGCSSADDCMFADHTWAEVKTTLGEYRDGMYFEGIQGSVDYQKESPCYINQFADKHGKKTGDTQSYFKGPEACKDNSFMVFMRSRWISKMNGPKLQHQISMIVKKKDLATIIQKQWFPSLNNIVQRLDGDYSKNKGCMNAKRRLIEENIRKSGIQFYAPKHLA
jgi:hypothetical protein